MMATGDRHPDLRWSDAVGWYLPAAVFAPGWLAQEMKSASEEFAAWPEWKRRSYEQWWKRTMDAQRNTSPNAGPYYSNFRLLPWMFRFVIAPFNFRNEFCDPFDGIDSLAFRVKIPGDQNNQRETHPLHFCLLFWSC